MKSRFSVLLEKIRESGNGETLFTCGYRQAELEATTSLGQQLVCQSGQHSHQSTDIVQYCRLNSLTLLYSHLSLLTSIYSLN